MENPSNSPDKATGLVGAGQLSRLLMITPERLRQLARAGHIPVAIKGRYPLVGAIQGYLAFLTDSRRDNGAPAAGLAIAKTHEVRLRTDRIAAGLIETAAAEAALRNMLGTLQTEIAKAKLPPAVAKPARAAVAAAFARAECQAVKAFADLRAGRDPVGEE